MNTEIIVRLILALAPVIGVDSTVALSVAKVESGLNPDAIGDIGEIGVYQIRPEFAKGYTKKQLHDPFINIYLGLLKIREAQEKCIHKRDINYLICYNYGFANALKVKHPTLFPYVKRVKKEMEKMKYAYNSSSS